MRTRIRHTTIITDHIISVAYGVIAGVGSYILLNGISGLIRKLTGDRIVPPAIDAAEPWVIPPGGLIPIWFQKVTGRYVVEPHIEMEENRHHRHDTVSMETASQGDMPKRNEYGKGMI